MEQPEESESRATLSCLGSEASLVEGRQRVTSRSCKFVLHEASPPCSEVLRTWWSCCFHKHCHLSLSWHTQLCLRGTERKEALASFLQKEHSCFLHIGKHLLLTAIFIVISIYNKNSNIAETSGDGLCEGGNPSKNSLNGNKMPELAFSLVRLQMRCWI